MHKVDANQRFLDSDSYITLARSFMGKRYKRNQLALINSIVTDEDLVDALTDIDLKFDPSRGCSLCTYRYICLHHFLIRKITRRNPAKKFELMDSDAYISDEPMKRQVEARDYLNVLFRRAELTEKQKRVLEKRYYEGMKMPRIAETENCSRQNIDQLLKRTIGKLAREVDSVR